MSPRTTDFDGGESLSQDVIFDVLSSKRRRQVISLLRESAEPIKLTTLAERIAAMENDTTVDELPRQARKRVYVSLYQTHVPRLADVGLVEYDSESGEVSLTPRASAVEPYLNESHGGPRWAQYYLALAVVGLGLLVAGWLDVGVLAALSPVTVGAFLVAALTLLTIVHARVERRNSLAHRDADR